MPPDVNQLYDPLRDEEIKPAETQSWLITFSDLVMLMLVFFVLLFSVSSVNAERFKQSFQSVRSEFSGKIKFSGQAGQSAVSGSILDSARLQQQLIIQQEKIFTQIKTYLTESGKEEDIGAVFDKGIITLRLPSDVLFEPGSVELSQASERSLAVIADIMIKHKDQDLNIKGYTDDSEPTSGRFKNLWEISAVRAANILHYLMSMGIESSRLTATGLADMNPLLPNDSDENRAKNRRVEFVLERKIGE